MQGVSKNFHPITFLKHACNIENQATEGFSTYPGAPEAVHSNVIGRPGRPASPALSYVLFL